MSAFGQVLRAEFTKFRTVRGWVVATVAGAGVTILLGLLPGMQGSCGRNGPGSECEPPVGPGGEVVVDSFAFAHRPLTGDGSITVRVTSLSSRQPHPGPGPGPDEPRPAVVPWSKAGLMLKVGTAQGSSYTAVMVTGGHGVRMQYDYTHDRAGAPGAVSAGTPRWLRLTRAGDTVTAAESPDGTTWATVGSVRLAGLPPTVEAGLFTTSPQYAERIGGSLGAGAMGGPTEATGTFDHLLVRGAAHPADASGQAARPEWAGENVGVPGPAPQVPGGDLERAGGVFTMTGSGDIGPAVAGAAGIGVSLAQTLVGTFVLLLVVTVVSTGFITAEYRRGLIRTTLAASPRRGRLLAAKAVVVGAVAFAAGLPAAAVRVVSGQRVLRGNGVYVHPTSTSTELRVIVGTAALLAGAAVLALGLGTLLRRGVTAVTTAVAVIVLPYLLAMTVLPDGAARWLLRVSPAAAFALQQTATRYPQVANLYTPADGYFPLAPWAGFGVLAGWAALVLGLAAVLFGRRGA
ncbi:ABC transporter permease subunit [Parafrankia discariae]|uniref:ABC transporter permease subunit n=1 Tax=Parafrankia discariae TaxID=365528 RepID=UPI00035FCCC8|nr:ABC transporter permease subunit [Parafrankia discariae]